MGRNAVSPFVRNAARLLARRFVLAILFLTPTGVLRAQNAVLPVQLTALKQNRSGDSTMQMERGMVVTQITNASARQLIEAAYGVEAGRISGGPAWAKTLHYDLAYTGGALSSAGTGTALRQILADRFHLAVKQGSKATAIYALVAAPGGARLKGSALVQTETGEPQSISHLDVNEDGGRISLTGGVGALADALRLEVDRPIVDRTGLGGTYSIDFHWAASNSPATSISAALQQQLGLDLLPQSADLPSVTIQRIDQPAEM